jgi:hypothetical protein
MNHRKHKQAENSKRPKKEVYNPYANDPPDAKCPVLWAEWEGICSYINSCKSWMDARCV